MAVIATEGLSVLLFKSATLILGILLGLQLLGTVGRVPFDITEVFTFEQFLFVYILSVVVLLAFIEARTMQNRAGGGLEGFTIGVLVGFAIALIGLALLLLVIFAEGTQFNSQLGVHLPNGYDFDNSEINELIGWYLLVGAILIFINARNQIFKARILFR